MSNYINEVLDNNQNSSKLHFNEEDKLIFKKFQNIDDDKNSSKRKFTNDEKDNETELLLSPSKKPKIAKPKVNISPKKRLNLASSSNSEKSTKNKFIYGNYSRYYGYRVMENFHDIRLDVFAEYKDLFENKEILDIGCNTGLITIAISKEFNIKSITGIDIDRSLIKKVKTYLRKCRKNFKETTKKSNCFPFNINFIHGNYVLRDDVLLEIEHSQFDVICCLSVTKWIHLNFGDAGLKQAFRRMFIQLRPGGKLILEPQSWDGYRKRKKITEEIFNNYKSIQFFPKDFNDYLLSSEVGFSEMYELRVPEHKSKGFKRPIYVFVKKE